MPATVTQSEQDGDKSFEKRYAAHFEKVAQAEAKLRAARAAVAKRLGREDRNGLRA